MKGKIDLHAIISHLILATEPNITDDQITNRNIFYVNKKEYLEQRTPVGWFLDIVIDHSSLKTSNLITTHN